MAPSEFEKLLKSYVRSLDAFKASLDQYGSAARKHEQTSENQDQKPLPIEIRSELRLPVTVSEYYEAKQRERQSAWPTIKAWLEIVGVVVAVVLAVLTYYTLRKISSQADSAQQQVVIMQRQLEATDRPWIKIKGASVYPDFSFFGDSIPSNPTQNILGVTMVEVAVENVGRSIAINAYLRGELIFLKGMPEAMQEQSLVCSGQSGTTPTILQSIFPGDPGPRFFTSAEQELTAVRKGQEVKPVFLGCIVYAISNSAKLHHSAFMYALEQLADGAHWEDKPFPRTDDRFQVVMGARIDKDRMRLVPVEPSPFLNLGRSAFDAD
jgi:hypothetical protein